jgi:maltooligosyltrehalose trehalohydrolase
LPIKHFMDVPVTELFTYKMPWGAQWAGGKTRFHLWAPSAVNVSVELDREGVAPMLSVTGGHWELELPCKAGSTYRYVMTLTDGQLLSIADPASKGQDGDLDDPSCVIDPCSYVWENPDWLGRPWHEAVVYELHVGLLGGFKGVTEKLPALAALGITAVELMPVADFPGGRNWGYDGVLPFAPDTAYGSPEELKHLIDTAHGLGLMVLLDVVYNHFGPDGNYLTQYAPEFFHSGPATAWGGAIDFSVPEVRSFFTSNALYWIMEYRFDGLRIDAAHAIAEQDWLIEMASAVRAQTEPGRHVHLVLEHDGNAANLLAKGFDAQWNDDGHHVLHALLTGENDSYYADYADTPAEKLARLLAQGFIYQGDPSLFRNGKPRGEPSASLSTTAFVFFLQNHDQTGNRAFGERLTVLADRAALRAAQALQLLTPHIPLIFMGEESASTTPFLYFTSHRTPELAEAVRKGRWQEFSATKAFADEARRETIPVPNDESTFELSRPASVGEQGDPSTAWVKDLLAVRRQYITPHLSECQSLGAEVIGKAAVVARWKLGPQILMLTVNLAADEIDVAAAKAAVIPSALAETIFDSGGVRKQLSIGKVPAHAFLAVMEPR